MPRKTGRTLRGRINLRPRFNEAAARCRGKPLIDVLRAHDVPLLQ